MITLKRKRKIGMNPIAKTLVMLMTLFLFRTTASESDSLPLENLLAPNSAFWHWSASEFEPHMRRTGFRWMQQGISARAAPPGGTFFGFSAYEAVIRFQNGAPQQFMVSFFNRGDSREMLTEEDFEARVRDILGAMNQRLHRQGVPGEARPRSGRNRDETLVWIFPEHRFELSHSHTPARREDGRAVPFTAEYIRLTVQRARSTELPAHMRTFVNRIDLLQNIQRNEAGDVWIPNIPMVDQGEKGYCATATAERVMRFFGQNVDQHQIAQMANTTAEDGTSPEALRRSLETIARQFRYSLNNYIVWDVRSFQRMVDQHNRFARQRGGREVALPRTGVIYVDQVYQMFDRETFIESRAGRRVELNQFEDRVRRYVDGGVPLIWGVMLGVVPEPEIPQLSGGHLRLIIGYNAQTREILFSDTWGRGHELKRMTLEHAFAITTSLNSLVPQGIRL